LIRLNRCVINGENSWPIPVCSEKSLEFRVFISMCVSPAQKGTLVESGNRKLIRPSFNEFKEKSEAPARKTGAAAQKRQIPPDQTNAENFYYVKQMQSKTPMAITLKDGEVLKGVIEWYDRSCLKLNRDGEPNLLLYKSNIKYMYKDEEA
jgi:sRNA-binding regulator protein Hfq